MENPSRIKDFTYYVLNKAEYLSFMNHVIDLVKEPIEEGSPGEISMLAENGVPELGLEKEFIETFEVDLLAMADVVDESRIAQETESLGNLDTDRDNIATYITTRVTRSKALPIKAERDAGQHLLTYTNRRKVRHLEFRLFDNADQRLFRCEFLRTRHHHPQRESHSAHDPHTPSYATETVIFRHLISI